MNVLSEQMSFLQPIAVCLTLLYTLIYISVSMHQKKIKQ